MGSAGKKQTRRKNISNTRPPNFRDFETLAKGILEGQGISYFEWLHEKHQGIILDFNKSNKKEIATLAKEGE